MVMEWTDEAPTTPGWYIWTMDRLYRAWQLTGNPLIAVPCDLTICEYDGWWLGPLHISFPFVRLPRVSDTRIATGPKRQQIRQSDVRNLLAIDADARYSTGGLNNYGHRHDELCCTLGCINRTTHPHKDADASMDHSGPPHPGSASTEDCQAD